jgi:hypothetical protein
MGPLRQADQRPRNKKKQPEVLIQFSMNDAQLITFMKNGKNKTASGFWDVERPPRDCNGGVGRD